MNSHPTHLVSVCVQTYNHENYIAKCLEGILMQQTSFPVEIILGEDESSDGTREICHKYTSQHPNTIKLFLRSRKDVIYINGNPTGRFNFIENLKACRGKYIALCEGDDYWTDPLKLQKQVDFLEANKEFNICFHRANLLKNESQLELHPIPETSSNREYLFKDLLENYNFILTASVVFRRPDNFIMPEWFLKLPFGDLGLYQQVLNKKKIKCLDDIMSVYRIHSNGMWTGLSKIKREDNFLDFYQIILPHLTLEEKEIVKVKMKAACFNIAKLKFPKMPWLQKVYYFYLSKTRNLN